MERTIACIDGNGRGICRTETAPPVGAGQVGVRVEASLISPGTELGGVAALRAQPDPGRPPRPFGYGNAGVVEQVGPGVEQFRPGQRVACMGAGYALHTDFACVPQNLCVVVPDGVSAAEAAAAHLAATALQAVRRAEPQFGENALVMGLGLVGQLTAQLAQLCGCHAMGVDRLPLRTRIGRQVGIERVVLATEEDPVAAAALFSGGYGIDFGVIAFGGDANTAFEQVRDSLKLSPDGHRMGRVVIVGGARISHLFAAGLGNVDVRSSARTGPGYHDQAYELGAPYPPVFVPWTTQRNLTECLRAVACGRLQVRPLLTNEFPLSDIGAAVDALVDSPDQALGVVLRP
jgi:threonine dehydrogenase-like Zn-dependent dehydrogenase